MIGLSIDGPEYTSVSRSCFSLRLYPVVPTVDEHRDRGNDVCLTFFLFFLFFFRCNTFALQVLGRLIGQRHTPHKNGNLLQNLSQPAMREKYSGDERQNNVMNVYVRIVHVGGTRCVTWSIDRIIQIHARITWGVVLILAIVFIFFLYV